jgi:hypothetical protein
LLFNVVYIQSIGSGIGIFSGLLLSTLVPLKPSEDQPSRRLTQAEKDKFTLSKELKDILVGLMMGDLYALKRGKTVKGNTALRFEQGIGHEKYLLHLFELFQNYCPSSPKITNRLPDKRTGKIYSRISFNTYSLPCFN